MKRSLVVLLWVAIFAFSSVVLSSTALAVTKVSGERSGTYRYVNNNQAPVDFWGSIREENDTVWGSLTEPRTFGPNTPYLMSSIFGSVDGTTIRFRKIYTYDPSHTVEYLGTFDSNSGLISGYWRIGEATGPFKIKVKAGQDTGNVKYGALRIDCAYHEGPYIRIVHGTVKDPQGLWQALLPLQPPPGARGDYGLIGDDNLLGQESGFGLRQLGSIARRYITFDAVYVEQPEGFSVIGVQSGAFTSVEAMNDTTLGWVFFDLRPKIESGLKKYLKLDP